jgi:uncharacterized protein YcaQ
LRTIGLAGLRTYALARTFREPATLDAAIRRLGFVQADPIRAPARAQDLTLRHRVADYRAGDLERHYPSLEIEEDCLVNYGFLPRDHLLLMHPRVPARRWGAATRRRAAEVLAFIRERGTAHPRDVAAHFSHGRVANYWGGASNATTRLLDGMHYRGMLRVARRDQGIRVYAAQQHAPRADDARSRSSQADALLALVVAKYAPLPASSLVGVVYMLRYAAPHLTRELKAALSRAKARLAHANVDGVDWYWPGDDDPNERHHVSEPRVRLLAPFDPAVWDRRRFEQFWGWAYRFEAYVPAAKRRLGYYALPLLWCDEVIGWGNLSVRNGKLATELGYVTGRAPRDRAFKRERDAEIARMESFLGL